MNNFKNSTVYQIYVKSFKDSNNDGIGDINGITEKLDYLKDLGIDYIWTTPFFKSPLNDNGYDVSDYMAIDPVFGTMEDVDNLIKEAENRNIGLMFDMVFNHTSTEHEWFKKALSGDKKYMDYYIFKDGKNNKPPTNWQSKFGGSAWEYVPSLDKYYLHLFDVSQADLNWDNKQVREELKNVIRFWKNKGVKGFRFDVVNLISKPKLFEDDNQGDGRRFYTDGINVHEYIRELAVDTNILDMITVGEMSSTSIDNCIKYSNPASKELSMVFNFHHLKVDYKNADKWQIMPPDFMELKRLFKTWQEKMQEGNGWNAVFWCNHDQPRAVSRFGDDKKYRLESAKMLATCIHLMRGTPYVYQGEEIGMTNHYYTSISDYKDVESINYYKILSERGLTDEEALEILSCRSRDNSRTPMQWNCTLNAGFSKSEPWIKIPTSYSEINVEKDQEDRLSILNYYKKLIKLRKDYPVISEGSIKFVMEEYENIIAYERYHEGKKLLVLLNLREDIAYLKEDISLKNKMIIISNYDMKKQESISALRAYESIAILEQ